MKDPFSEELFNPYHLRPLATLNSRRVIALPGVDPELIGKTGHDLLSKQALAGLIRPHARELGLDDSDLAEYPQRLNALLDSPQIPAYSEGQAIAEQFGQRLGCLIASIILSPEGLTRPLAPWEAGYLHHWKEEVRSIILAGGHASGRLGAIISRAAQEVLARCGLERREVQPAAHPSYLPLIGAARTMREAWRPQEMARPAVGVVADFGGSRAKRGIVYYDETGRLYRLRLLPDHPIPSFTGMDDVEGLAAEMIRIIAETVRTAGETVSPHIVCSVAAYVENGAPLNTMRGMYNMLNHISPDIKGWFSRQVSAAVEATPGIGMTPESICREVQVEFAHDSDAAARALAGRPKTAVIMMGSALAVGFAPPESYCCPLADGFTVEAG